MVKRISSRFGDMFDYNLTPSQRSQLYEQDTKEGMGLSTNPYAYDKNNVYSYAVPEPVVQPMGAALKEPNSLTTANRLSKNTDSAFPYEVENRDARVGEGFTYGTGMGPSAPPNNEVSFPPNSAMMQQEINQGLLSNPNFDLTKYYESPPNNEVSFPPNSAMMQREIDQDFDLTKYYESPPNFDMTKYYESPPNFDMTNFYESPPNAVGINNSAFTEKPDNYFSNTLEGVPGSVSDPEVNLNVADLTEGAILGGPTASSFALSNNPNATDGQRVGGVLGTIGSLASSAIIPGSSIIGLLGGIFNAMGAYQDPSEVTGNIVSQGGLLSGNISGPGSYFTQTGGLNNYNFFDDLASTNPNQAVTYNGMETNAAGARNLSGLDNYYGEGSTGDATAEGDATGGWGSYSSDMDADSYGGYY